LEPLATVFNILGAGPFTAVCAALLALAARIEETVARATELGGEPAAHAAALKAHHVSGELPRAADPAPAAHMGLVG
jgi:hypothetical protein